MNERSKSRPRLIAGADPGGPPPSPIFGKVNFIFFTVYNVWKKILNFDFLVAEIRWTFGSVGGGVCVCVCVCVIP